MPSYMLSLGYHCSGAHVAWTNYCKMLQRYCGASLRNFLLFNQNSSISLNSMMHVFEQDLVVLKRSALTYLFIVISNL